MNETELAILRAKGTADAWTPDQCRTPAPAYAYMEQVRWVGSEYRAGRLDHDQVVDRLAAVHRWLT